MDGDRCISDNQRPPRARRQAIILDHTSRHGTKMAGRLDLGLRPGASPSTTHRLPRDGWARYASERSPCMRSFGRHRSAYGAASAVASSSFGRGRSVPGEIGLAQAFETLVTGSEVENGTPDPELTSSRDRLDSIREVLALKTHRRTIGEASRRPLGRAHRVHARADRKPRPRIQSLETLTITTSWGSA